MFFRWTFSFLLVSLAVNASVPYSVEMKHMKSATPLASIQGSSTAQWKLDLLKAMPNTPISGNILPYGIFWLQIDLGTPSRKYNVAIDTGSSDTIVSVVGCNGCSANSTSYYHPTQSSTSKNVSCDFDCRCVDHQCHFSNTYETCDLKNPTAPCTIAGPLYKDAFALAAIKGEKPLTFGGIDYQTKNFEQFQHIHGVIGLAGRNFFGTPTPVQQLAEEGKIPSSSFAMCFNDNGGKFTAGGADSSLQSGPFNYTANGGFGMFSATCHHVLVGGTQIAMREEPLAIIDSGTNNLLLPSSVFDPLYDEFNTKYCSGSNMLPHVCKSSTPNLFTGACFAISDAERMKFPDISLVLNGATLVLHQQDYLLKKVPFPKNGEAAEYCLGIGNTGGSFFIIGDTIMTNYYTLFDVEKRRIGWAPVNAANCFPK